MSTTPNPVTEPAAASFAKAWGEAWSAGGLAALLRFYSPDCAYTDVGSDLTVHGHAGLTRFHEFMLAFAPDSAIRFEPGVGDDRGFAARWVWSGTAAGPLRVGETLYPAAGTTFTVPGVAYCTLADDRTIASHEDYYDMHALVQRLTSLKETRAATAVRRKAP